MNLEFKPLPYKKVDGIYSCEENSTKWQKFWTNFGKVIAKGLFGKWEINFKIKF